MGSPGRGACRVKKKGKRGKKGVLGLRAIHAVDAVVGTASTYVSPTPMSLQQVLRLTVVTVEGTVGGHSRRRAGEVGWLWTVRGGCGFHKVND